MYAKPNLEALRHAVVASEERYRAIFNAAVDCMVLRDATFRIVDVNPAYEAMSGRARDEVLGRDVLTMSPLEMNDYVRALHALALGGETVVFESRARRKNGERFHIETRGVPIEYGGSPHVLYVGRDITARYAAEKALRASEEQYRAIFNAAADAFVLRDADFRIVDVNAAYVALSGYSRDEVIGVDHVVANPLENSRIRALHERALGGEAIVLETQRVPKHGVPIDVELRGVPMRYRGQPHVLYIGRDISQRKRAEAILRASEEQYRSIFNATTDALVLRDDQARVVDVNPAFLEISGYTREEVVNDQRWIFAGPSMSVLAKDMHRRVINGESVHFEVEGTRKDGSALHVEMHAVPILYRGKPHALGMARDITQSRRAEEERAALEAQLRQAQRMEAIGHLTGGIAHDFNNILQGILGNLTLAADRQADLGDARLGKYLERAQHSAQRARELIAQMLTFSRGQRGARRPVALPDLVRDASKLLRSTLPSTIDLRLALDDAAPMLELDPVQVEQVVLNLCINARDAMRGTGAIRIGLQPAARIQAVCASCRQKVDGRFVELWVRDTGPGIAPEVLDRMFEPFYSTKETGRGSGMGLSLAHGIVHEHGGHILVDTILNERTKFRVLLPAPEGNAAGPQLFDLATLPPTKRPKLKGRVLVVDDEQAIREFMSDLLGGWGLEVATLSDGAAARDAIATDPQRFDLVITDQTMPQLTGLALAKLISRLRPGLPVILYTGYAEDLSPQQLREAGVVKLVRKPIEPAQFFPLLAAHLKQ